MKKWLYPLSCLTIALAVSACASNNAAGPKAGPRTNAVDNAYRAPSTYHYGVPGSVAYGPGNNAYGPGNMGYTDNFRNAGFDRRLADRIARAADSVPGVERAAALVRGNDVVVGVQTRMKADNRTQRRVVERQVYSAVRAIAPAHHIRVTSDGAMVTRIRNLDTTLRGGARGATDGMMGGPRTVTGNLGNVGNDFTGLLRDLGRTVTAPFR
jgi:hypothetical protein